MPLIEKTGSSFFFDLKIKSKKLKKFFGLSFPILFDLANFFLLFKFLEFFSFFSFLFLSLFEFPILLDFLYSFLEGNLKKFFILLFKLFDFLSSLIISALFLCLFGFISFNSLLYNFSSKKGWLK